MSRALWNILIILSKWTRSVWSDSRRQQGLTLELSAYAPSDSKHTSKGFHLEQSYLYQEEEDLDPYWEAYRLKLDSINNLCRGSVNSCWNCISLESERRIMGTLTINLDLPELSVFSQTFPKVEIFTGLLIGRQFYRKIAISSLSKLPRAAFTCL